MSGKNCKNLGFHTLKLFDLCGKYDYEKSDLENRYTTNGTTSTDYEALKEHSIVMKNIRSNLFNKFMILFVIISPQNIQNECV